MNRALLLAGAVLGLSCSSPKGDDTAVPDTVPGAAVPDTNAAAALRDSARAVVATLLADSSTAMFDSLVVVQPPAEGNRMPSMAVCGRVAGKPGIKGRTTPTRFVYRTRFALFVQDDDNTQQFADLWATNCTSGTVVLRG